MKKLVIIPTYNELENVKLLIPELLKLKSDFDILFVDDSSPDGTGEYLMTVSVSNHRINLLSRSKKEGLGKAYIAGFKWGLEKNYDTLTEMDADFSHRPLDLDQILNLIESENVVIGSRYIPGGKVVNWGLIRKIISRGGSIYARVILGYPINDWTGGFNTWKRNVLEKINLDSIQSNGYSFQIELKYKAQVCGFKIVEYPIIFEDRRIGQSKMSFRILLEAIYKVWLIRFG
jgi:dolichol-phosphate mannosyltransferase